ncbi:hypothetical protein [Shewanella halifaxensis]|uniref:hypothetical protein n=1 Tax=Shewanella halifaxensis TaxID=271098 RepID=UPI000D59DE52|nr:hypothetical protein [Shewanella halifaxensis]
MSIANVLTATELEAQSVKASSFNSLSLKGDATKATPLAHLLEREDLWLGEQWQHQNQAYPSGFVQLDQHLADNGWPKQGVCECLCDKSGQGELTLVLPLLQQLIGKTGLSAVEPSNQVKATHSALAASVTTDVDSLVMLVAPPYVPNPQALEQQGVEVERLIWIDSCDRKEQLWAIEQALASGAVPLVLAWLDYVSITESRRLQLAAEKGQALCLLYLPTKLADNAHPVNLRLTLQRSFFRRDQANMHAKAHINTLRPVVCCGDSRINIIKRRGGWPSKAFSLSLLPPHLKQSLLGVPSYSSSEWVAAEIIKPDSLNQPLMAAFKLSIVNNDANAEHSFI